MMRALGFWFWISYAAVLGGGVAEGVLAASRAPSGVVPLAQWLWALATAPALATGAACVLACVVVGGVRGAHWVRARLPLRLDAAVEAVDWAAAIAIALLPTIVVIAWLQRMVSAAWNNQELAALAAAGLTVGGTVVAIAITAVLARASRQWRQRARALEGRRRTRVLIPGVTSTAALLVALVGSDHVGGSQLEPWLIAAPLLTLLSGVTTARVLKGLGDTHGDSTHATPTVLNERRRTRIRLAVIAAGILLGMVGVTRSASAWTAMESFGAWSRWGVPALRALSDFDRDGYSAWFDGGDCAAWNPEVNPGQRERPGNGIDDNCAGGDAATGEILKPPEPSATPLVRLNRPNLLLVTIETLRADRVSFLGYARPTTPQLDALARESVVFERLYATTPTTRLSLPALLSGTMPSRIDWQPQPRAKRMRRVGPRTPWWPETLRRSGYATIAVHASFRAFTAVESAGFDRGFAHYDVSTPLAYQGGTMRGFPGAEQIDRALELVADVSGRPFFLWVHLLEPHYLYEQPPSAPKFGDTEQDLYDAEIREADRQVGRLVEALRARGVWTNTVALVSGDHGEEFGEHGERWHTSNLYEPQVRTAGLLRVPGLPPQRVRAAVSLTDLGPTLLDLLGLHEDFPRMHGRNLVPLLRSPAVSLLPFFLENFRVHDGQGHQVALIAWPFKLIDRGAGTYELYDLQADPLERMNLRTSSGGLAGPLIEQLQLFREGIR